MWRTKREANGHYHIHGPLNNQTEITNMINVLCIHTDVKVNIVKNKTPKPFKTKVKHISSEQTRLSKRYSTTATYEYKERLA